MDKLPSRFIQNEIYRIGHATKNLYENENIHGLITKLSKDIRQYYKLREKEIEQTIKGSEKLSPVGSQINSTISYHIS